MPICRPCAQPTRLALMRFTSCGRYVRCTPPVKVMLSPCATMLSVVHGKSFQFVSETCTDDRFALFPSEQVTKTSEPRDVTSVVADHVPPFLLNLTVWASRSTTMPIRSPVVYEGGLQVTSAPLSTRPTAS